MEEITCKRDWAADETDVGSRSKLFKYDTDSSAPGVLVIPTDRFISSRPCRKLSKMIKWNKRIFFALKNYPWHRLVSANFLETVPSILNTMCWLDRNSDSGSAIPIIPAAILGKSAWRVMRPWTALATNQPNPSPTSSVHLKYCYMHKKTLWKKKISKSFLQTSKIFFLLKFHIFLMF